MLHLLRLLWGLKEEGTSLLSMGPGFQWASGGESSSFFIGLMPLLPLRSHWGLWAPTRPGHICDIASRQCATLHGVSPQEQGLWLICSLLPSTLRERLTDVSE